MRAALLLIVLIGITQLSYGQDFYKDYRFYLVKKTVNHNPNTENAIDFSVKLLKQGFIEFKSQTGYSFLSLDTLYIISFLDLPNHPTLVWNKKGSWISTHETRRVGNKVIEQQRTIQVNANETLKQLPARLKQCIQNGDTLYFTNYAKKFNVLNSSAVSFKRAIKKGKRWTFISASSYDIDL